MNTKTFLTTFTGAITSAIASGLMTTLPVHALSFFSSGGTIDNSSDTNFAFINVAGTSNPSTVSLNIASITSGSLSGLTIYLQSPSDTLLLANGLSDDTFNNVTFSGDGSATISTPSYDNGTFLPLDSFSDLEDPFLATIDNFADFSPVSDGNWSLLIRSVNTNPGDSIGQITLNITPVPFEFSPALGLVGLGAVWAFNQSRKKK